MDGVEVSPVQPGDFASSDAGVGGEVECRVEPLAARGAQERRELVGRPNLSGGRAPSRLGWSGVPRRVGGDEMPVDREIERVGDDPVENVIASIEVKANLTVPELQGALDSLRRFRRLAPAIPGRSSVSSEPGNLLRQNIPVCGPFTAVFAFERTGLSAGRFLHECQQHQASGTIDDRINGGHVLGHSGTMWVDRTDTKLPALTIDPQARDLPDLKKWEGRPLELATNMVSGGNGLRLFLATLLGFVNWYKPPELNLNERMLSGISLPFDVGPRAPDDDSGDT